MGEQVRRRTRRRQVKISVYLPPDLAAELYRRATGGGGGITHQAATAIREYLARQVATTQESLATPVLDNLLLERLGQVESWLRPMVAAASIHSATAMLLALEALCGTRVDPSRAKETLDLMRGRAYKMIRRRDEAERQG